MKIIFVVILYLLCVAITLQCLYVFKKKEKKLRRLVALMLTAAATGTVYSIIIFTKNEKMAEIEYTIYFSCHEFLMLFGMLFCSFYTGYGEKNKWLKVIPSFLAIVDCVSMVSLQLFGEFITLTKREILYSGTMWVPDRLHPYFNVHLISEYIFILIWMLMLLLKSSMSPKEYKGRYNVIFYGTASIVFAKTMLLLINPSLDISVILYLIISIITYYVSVNYYQSHMNLSTAKTVFNELDDLLVCFDLDNKCTFINRKAEEFIKVDNVREYCTNELQKWIKENPGFKEWTGEAHSWDVVTEENGNKNYMNVRVQKNFDEIGNYTGCYFQIKDVTEITRNYRERQKRLMLDPLTLVYRREYFFDRVKEILMNSGDKKYSMICTNIIGFSVYNSIFGEEQGNQVLRRNGDLIRNMREITVAFGRVYGDIFGILVETDNYSESYLSGMVKRLKDEFGGKHYNLRAMVGIYDIDNINEPVSSMCDKACTAIDTHKQEYNRIICRYNQWDYDETLNETVILARFQKALDDNQFNMFIQAQVTSDGKVLGGEALSRWIDNDGKMIPPIDFIPVLEKNGAIYKLDQYVWEQAAKRLSVWKKKNREDLYISVNISAKDFYYIDIYDVFTSLVKKYDINPARLKLEITESVIVQDSITINEILQKLREFGFNIEIDDFGSGYSSLGMLKDIVVDVLKLDMSFLRKATTTQEERMWLIMEQMVHLAEALGMETVVEGVETSEQADRLSSMGCKVFQGFFYAKPEMIDDFEKRAKV